MAAKTYSAGTIFLQVVPVFGDTMDAIKRQAKDANKAWGDEAERAGKEAGERAGKAQGEAQEKAAKESGKRAGSEYAGHFQEQIRTALKGAQREMDTLSFKTLSDDAEDRIKRIGKLFKELDAEITPEMNDKRFLAKLDFLRADLAKLTEGKHELAIQENIDHVIGKVTAGIKLIDKEVDKKREIEIVTKISDRDLGSFEKKLRDTARRAGRALGDSINPEIQKIKARLDGLSDVEIGIDMDAGAARAELISIDQALAALPREVDIDANVNSTVAHAELLSLRREINLIDGHDIDIPINVKGAAAATASVAATSGALSGLRAAFQAGGGGADAAANSFRSFNFAILGVVTLLPAIVPMLGAVGGGLLALIPILGAVAAGIGVLMAGFSGIGDAVGALGDVQDNAAKDSQASGKKMESASQGVADAERNLAEARRSAAESVGDAERSLEEARKSAAQAEGDAQRQLARTREQASKDIQDAIDSEKDAQDKLKDSLRDVADAQRDLAKAKREAQYDIRDTNNDVSQNRIDMGQATIALGQAESTYNATNADGSATNQEKYAAQLGLDEARLKLKELEEQSQELAEQKAKNDAGGVNGTEKVQTAEEALLQAIKDQKTAEEDAGKAAQDTRDVRVKAARDIRDAERNLARTREQGAQQVADAERNLTRARAAGARSVADAQRSLTKAQKGYGDAVVETADLGSASMQKLDQAMSKLGPAGQAFAKFIFGLRGQLYATRDAIQESLLPPVQHAIEKIIKTYGPQFQGFAVSLADVLGRGFDKVGDRLTKSPAWKQFFGMIESISPTLLSNAGEAGFNFLEAFANLMTIVAPYSVTLSESLVDISEATKNWVASAKGTDTIRDFMDYAQSVGPGVLDFFTGLWKAFVNIAKAIAPWGEMVLGALTHVVDFIANLDPKILGAIVGGLIALTIAFQAAVGVVALAFAGAAVFATTAGTVVFAVVALAGAFAILYHSSKTFRDLVGSLTDFLSEHRDTLLKVAEAAGVAYGIYKAWRATLALARGTMIAYSFAVTAQTVAVEANTKAVKIGMALNKVFFGLQKTWTAITNLLTIANLELAASFLANPVVLIVIAIIALIAVLVLLFKKNKTFHDAVMKLWGYIKVAGVAVWDALKVAFKAAVDFIVSFWNSYLKPVFVAIGQAAVWLWHNVFVPAFAGIWAAVSAAFGFIKKAWTGVLWPIIDLIGTVIFKLYKLYFKVVFALIKAAVKVAFVAIKAYWDYYLHPVLNAFGSVISWLWDKIVKPNLPKIEAAFNAMKTTIHNAWVNFIKPALDTLGDVVDKLAPKFKTAVDLIKTAWDGLKKIVATPIHFMLDTVVNNGIVAGFNKIANFVGSKPMAGVPQGVIDAVDPTKMATGGVLPGYTPGRDPHKFYSPTGGRLELSGGEAIMRPEFTSVVGSGWVNKMNLLARTGGRSAVMAAMTSRDGYAKGGIFRPVKIGSYGGIHDEYTGYPAIDIPVPVGTNVYAAHSGTVEASYDLVGNEPRNAVQNGYYSYGRVIRLIGEGFHTLYAHLSNRAVQQGAAVVGGQPIGLSGSTGHSTGPHLHFGSAGVSPTYFMGGAMGNGSGAGGAKAAKPGRYPSWLSAVMKGPADYVKGLMHLDGLKALGDNPWVHTVTDVSTKLVKGVASKIQNIVPAASAFSAAGKLLHKGKDAVVGDHGKGTKGPTWGGNNGDAALDLAAATGGILPYNGTMKYDAGGYLPPGLTSVVNLTGKPEPVFTHDQFAGMDHGGNGDGGFHYEPHFEGSNLTAADVVRDMDHARRRQRREGAYARIRQ